MSTAALKSDSTGFPPGKSRDFRRDLLSDESGATMVIGVFMAAMLVGFLYYLHGTANMILHRDHLQDAADSSAFASAVIHARAMNYLVVLNIIMAVCAVIGTAFRICEEALLAGAVAATIVCIASWGSSGCSEAATNWSRYSSVSRAADRVENAMEGIIRVVNTVADVLVTVTPALAAYRVFVYAGEYGPAASMGWQIPKGMPVEEDDTNWPCDEKVSFAGWVGAAVVMTTMGDWNLYSGIAYAAELVPAIRNRHARHYCDDMDSFKRLEDDAWLGEEPFQLQTLVTGDSSRPRWTEQGVAVAGWSNDGTNISDSLDFLNEGMVAQSEYYFEDEGGMVRQEWIWHAQWRARMRRVDLGDSPLLGMIPGIDMLNGLVAH